MLGWDPDEQAWRADWDPAKHPRVLHGAHGGQFAHVPGSGASVPSGAAGGKRTVAEIYADVGAWAGILEAQADNAPDLGYGSIGKDIADAAEHLRWAERVMAKGDDSSFALAAKYVGEAGILADRGGVEGAGDRLRDLESEIIEATPESPLGGEFKAVQDVTAKGSKIVPDLLGGGRSAWDGKTGVEDYLDNPNAIAETDWYGQINYTTDEAKSLDAAMGDKGPIHNAAAWSVPLHELIHATIGGTEAERIKAHDEAVKGLRGGQDLTGDWSTLMDWSNSDVDRNRDRGTAGPWWHTLAQINEPEPEQYQVSQAHADWLASHGYLDKNGDQYRLSAKGLAATTPVTRETPADGRDDYQEPSVQAIEEGFTELGTIQHAPEFFDRMGIGDRPTDMIAERPADKPDLNIQAKVIKQLHELRTRTHAEGFTIAMKAVRDGKPDAAKAELDRMISAYEGTDLKWAIANVKDAIDSMYRRPVDNPEYKKRQTAMISAFSRESDLIRNRVYGPAAPGRLNDATQLTKLMQAMARAANDVDAEDFAGAAEELARLDHSGDTEYAKDAVKLRAQLVDVLATNTSKRATMSEYARRLQGADRIINGSAWGHYPQETAQALRWAQAVAVAEQPPLHGEALLKRVTEISDEVNREGTAYKLKIMARQAARAAGLTDPNPASLAQAENSIRKNWVDGGASLAFDLATQAAKNGAAK